MGLRKPKSLDEHRKQMEEWKERADPNQRAEYEEMKRRQAHTVKKMGENLSDYERDMHELRD